MKKIFVVFAVLCVAMFAFATASEEKVVQPTGPINVEFWSTWTGSTGEKIQAMADEFNSIQDKYVVTVIYNGGYGDAWAKLISLPKEDWPELVYMNAERMATLVYEDDLVTPMQKYIDEEKFDISDIQASLIGHYSDSKGNLIMMPMGNTVAGFFYNAELCEKAGVDPYKLDNFPDFVEACEKINAATGCPTPMAIGRNCIYYTFLYTDEGLMGLNNNNGRDEFPTEVLVGKGEGREATADYLRTIQKLSAEGLMAPFAGSTQDFIDLFSKQECAFLFFTCSSCTALNRGVNGAFEFGFLPAPTASANGKILSTPAGGGGIFIPSNGDDAAQKGAWEFVKFLINPKNTSIFSRATGYLPIAKSTATDPDYITYMDTVFKTARYCMDVQANSDPSASYTMGWPSGMDYSTAILSAIDTAIAEPTADVYAIVDKLQATLQESLDLVNAIR